MNENDARGAVSRTCASLHYLAGYIQALHETTGGTKLARRVDEELDIPHVEVMDLARRLDEAEVEIELLNQRLLDQERVHQVELEVAAIQAEPEPSALDDELQAMGRRQARNWRRVVAVACEVGSAFPDKDGYLDTVLRLLRSAGAGKRIRDAAENLLDWIEEIGPDGIGATDDDDTVKALRAALDAYEEIPKG